MTPTPATKRKRKARKIIIDGITHKDYLSKEDFGWWYLSICTRKDFPEGIYTKDFRRVHIVMTVKDVEVKHEKR
jgi:hypothetical protein